MCLYHPVSIANLKLDGNLFLAPVAGYSDRAFRSVCVNGGANFCYTEMVSAEALTRGSGKTESLMSRAPNEKAYAVQIFGGSPQTMASAATLVLQKTTADCIDINCGCPVPKIVKTGAGSALTRDPERLYQVVKAVVDSVAVFSAEKTPVPVTVKIRSGWDAQNITWKEAAEAAMKAGASAITIHARTKAQGYEGKSDWNILAELVKLVDGRIPVFGSGDVFTPEDAQRMLSQTGCDGVMFARGAMGKPCIFRQTRELLQTGSYGEVSIQERIENGFKELDILIADRGEEYACKEMRKRFCAYSKGIEGGSDLRAKIVHSSTKLDYEAVFSCIKPLYGIK